MSLYLWLNQIWTSLLRQCRRLLTSCWPLSARPLLSFHEYLAATPIISIHQGRPHLVRNPISARQWSERSTTVESWPISKRDSSSLAGVGPYHQTPLFPRKWPGVPGNEAVGLEPLWPPAYIDLSRSSQCHNWKLLTTSTKRNDLASLVIFVYLGEWRIIQAR